MKRSINVPFAVAGFSLGEKLLFIKAGKEDVHTLVPKCHRVQLQMDIKLINKYISTGQSHSWSPSALSNWGIRSRTAPKPHRALQAQHGCSGRQAAAAAPLERPPHDDGLPLPHRTSPGRLPPQPPGRPRWRASSRLRPCSARLCPTAGSKAGQTATPPSAPKHWELRYSPWRPLGRRCESGGAQRPTTGRRLP